MNLKNNEKRLATQLGRNFPIFMHDRSREKNEEALETMKNEGIVLEKLIPCSNMRRVKDG